jgi:hypothetical protein
LGRAIVPKNFFYRKTGTGIMTIDFQRLNDELAEFEPVEFSGGVSISAITEAEQAIGLKFGSEFREFLERFGTASISSQELLGLGGTSFLDVVTITRHLRTPSTHSRFPDNFIPVRGDGYGNYDCLDTSYICQEKGPRVVYWLHDGGDSQDCEVLSEGYGDWLFDILAVIRQTEA